MTSGNPGTAPVSNVGAAVWLHDRVKRKREEDKAVQQTAPQFEWAAGEPPRRCRTRLERSLHGGPTARRDADEAERQRWLQVLADLVRHSSTPMGQLLAAQPRNVEVLGAGKRASTLRSRVRAIRKFLRWLLVTRQLDYAQSVEHYTEYLRTRLSETCNRAALKTPHHALVFPGELAGTQPQDRPTSTKLYSVVFRELLATALPGRPSKQAPRMFVSMLRALEKVVTDMGHALLPTRVRLVEAGPNLGNVAVLGSSRRRSVSGFSAVLSWSKTIGAEKSVGSRPLTIAPLLLPVRASMVAHRVHPPSAARAVPARLSAPIAGVQLDRSALR